MAKQDRRGIFFRFLPLIVVLAFCLTPIIWFINHPGVLINGSDTNFPLDPIVWFKRRLYIWNDVSNAGIVFASSLAGLLFHLLQVIAFSTGVGLQGTEIITLVFWFSGVAISSYCLSRLLWPKNIISQLVFVSLYTFNVYLFNTWENIKVANISLVIGLPLVLFLYYLLKERKVRLSLIVLLSGLVGLLISGSGINPAYFITIILGLLVVVVIDALTTDKGDSRWDIWRNFVVLVTVLVLVNSYWIFPTLKFIFFSHIQVRGLADIGFTNWLDSLSENTSLVNVLRLQGAWDWYAMDEAGFPLYIPYALNFFKSAPFVFYSFLLTGLAFLSLAFRLPEKRKLYATLASFLILGIFLVAGGHEPTGSLYKLLVRFLPFFSFFRSPWYIFSPFVVLALSGLVATLFEYLSEKTKWRLLIIVASFLVVGGNLFYTYPLITGKIFRPAQIDNFYIKFPGYIFDSAKWLSANAKGRVVGYPDDEIERFKWGYNAVEMVLSLVSSSETLFAPLSEPLPEVSKLVRQFYLSLKKDEVDSALSVAGKLNVDLILDKKDQISLAPELPNKVQGFTNSKFGEWYFFKIPSENFVPKIYSSSQVYFGYPFNRIDPAISALKGKDLLLNPNDSVVNHIENLKLAGGSIIYSINSQEKEMSEFLVQPNTFSSRAIDRDLSKVNFSFDVPADGSYKPTLEKYHLKEFGLNDSGELSVSLDGQRQKWVLNSQNDSFITYRSIDLKKGSHLISIDLTNLNQAQKISDMTLVRSPKDMAVGYEVANFDPMADYLIKFKYQHVYGDFPSVIVEQRTTSSPVKRKTENLPIFPEWIPFSFYYDPVRTDSRLSVVLNAPHLTDPLGTRINQQDMAIYKVFTNKLLLIGKNNSTVLSSPDVSFNKKSPVLYEGIVKKASGPHLIIFSENYSPEWDLKIENLNGSAILAQPTHFSANLFANGWYVNGTPEEYKFSIRYAPQKVFYAGFTLSGIVLIGSIGYYIYETLIKKHG